MNKTELAVCFNDVGFKVFNQLIDKSIIDNINEKTDLLVPHRAHGINHKYYPHGTLSECSELGIWWSQQITYWPEIQQISKTLIDTFGSLFENPTMYVADIITNEPGNTFIKPHIDSPYRFDRWWNSQELLGVQCILPLCEFTEKNGGTGIMPESHKHQWVVKDSYAGLYNEEFMSKMIQPVMTPGDVLVYHPKMLHSTMPNKTDQRRRALLIHITHEYMIDELVKVDNIWLEGSK